jgi:phosphoribosylformimino-5-aminoimidazole carboxamide ribotide isomerase
MTIVPALDLRGGRCVRLRHGDPRAETRYDADPVERARAFVRAGAARLHVVDLDAAFGDGDNLAALRAICSSVDVPVQTGGGLRTAADVARRFAAGAAAAIVEEPGMVRAALDEWGERVIAGVDARGASVAVRGWLQPTSRDRDGLLLDLAALGFTRVISTEIARDGAGGGYDVAALLHVAALTPMRVTASGGAHTVADLRALAAAAPANLDSAIVGRALYEGTIDLAEAIAAVA